MRESGEGRVEQDGAGQRGRRGRWLGLLLSSAGLAALMVACAKSPTSGEAAGGASPSEPAKPQQVVQRIAPGPANPTQNAAVSNAAVSNAAVSNAAVPNAAVPNGGAGAKDAHEQGAAARAGSEMVTAKHVEAELNRLEAELK